MQHPPLIFNNTKVSQSITLKHLHLILDNWLSFEQYLATMGAKANKTIALLRMLQHILPWQALMTIYKAFSHPYDVHGKFFTTQRAINHSIKKFSLPNITLLQQ